MSGQLPTTKAFRTINLKSNWSNLQDDPLAGTRYVRKIGKHLWSMTASLPKMSKSVAFDIFGFLHGQEGKFGTFDVVPSDKAISRGEGGGTPTVGYSQLLPNGDFFLLGTTGWTGVNATLSVVSQALRVTASANGLAYAHSQLDTIVGQVYELTVDVVTIAKTGNVYLLVGTTSSTHDLFWQAGIAAPGELSCKFRATSSVSYIRLYLDSSTLAGEYADFDNVICKKSYDKIANGDFKDSVNSQWGLGAGFSIGGGLLSATPGLTSTATQPNYQLVIGNTYYIAFTILNRTVGVIGVTPSGGPFDGHANGIATANGLFEGNYVCTGTGNFELIKDSTFDGDVDDVTIIPLVPSVGVVDASILDVTGATPDVSGWLRKGDIFSIVGNSKVYMLTEDCDSDINGNARLIFEPPLLNTPDELSVVKVQNVSLKMALIDDAVELFSDSNDVYQIDIDLIEDIDS